MQSCDICSFHLKIGKIHICMIQKMKMGFYTDLPNRCPDFVEDNDDHLHVNDAMERAKQEDHIDLYYKE